MLYFLFFKEGFVKFTFPFILYGRDHSLEYYIFKHHNYLLIFNLYSKILHIYCWDWFISFWYCDMCLRFYFLFYPSVFLFLWAVSVLAHLLNCNFVFMFTFTEHLLCSRHCAYNNVVPTCEGEFHKEWKIVTTQWDEHWIW